MKPFPRDQMFGVYKGDRVMVLGVPDDISNTDDQCIIFFDSPLTRDYGQSREVRWGDVTELHGPAVEQRG